MVTKFKGEGNPSLYAIFLYNSVFIVLAVIYSRHGQVSGYNAEGRVKMHKIVCLDMCTFTWCCC